MAKKVEIKVDTYVIAKGKELFTNGFHLKSGDQVCIKKLGGNSALLVELMEAKIILLK